MRHAVQSGRVLLIAGLPTASHTIGGELEKNRQLVMELDRLAVETMPCSVSGWRLRPLATGLTWYAKENERDGAIGQARRTERVLRKGLKRYGKPDRAYCMGCSEFRNVRR